MKQFFLTVFGGLMAIGIGVGIAYGGSVAWRSVRPLAVTTIQSLSAASEPLDQTDGTSISGLRRTVRYSADEEEDLINEAAGALPQSPDSKITAKAYIVKNLTLGDTTIQNNAQQLLPIASLSKLVTAIVARKLIAPDERITITQDIMATYGNTAQFHIGETFTASDLYYPLLMVSSNDTAEALARHYGRAKFIKAMNDFTQSIGAYRTYFDDPSGLSPNNASTVNDLVLIVQWIRKNDPDIINITDLKSKTVRSHTWVNPTHFLSWSYYIGGKNGYIPEADRTGVSLFALGPNKNIYIVVVLGSDNRDADVIKLLSKVK